MGIKIKQKEGVDREENFKFLLEQLLEGGYDLSLEDDQSKIRIWLDTDAYAALVLTKGGTWHTE